jgi:hypothetical protein
MNSISLLFPETDQPLAPPLHCQTSSILTGRSTQSSSVCAAFRWPCEPPTGQKAPVPFWQHSGVFSGELQMSDSDVHRYVLGSAR